MITISTENKTKLGYVIIGICVFIFAMMAVSAVALKEEPYDPETLCKDIVDAHTIVVLDKTDSLSQSQQRFMLNYINKEKDNLKAFEKFSVFTLTENTFINPEPAFSKCNPGRGKDANKLYQNPRKIQMRFDENFSRPLKENMGTMLSKNVASQSPIFEMIRELSYRDDFGDNIQHRTLILISYMMAHTPRYSHYKGKPSYVPFANTDYAREVSMRLNGVDVKIIYLLRRKLSKYQGKTHLLFWEQYFEFRGANLSDVKSVW